MFKALIMYMIISLNQTAVMESRVTFDTMASCKAYLENNRQDAHDYVIQTYGEWSSVDEQCVTQEEYLVLQQGIEERNKKALR